MRLPSANLVDPSLRIVQSMQPTQDSSEPTGEASAPAGVHARVIPNFLVEEMHRAFSTWMGPIEPFELVRWTRGAPPPESVVEAIRFDALRRLRVRDAELWRRPMGIRLSPNWVNELRELEKKLVGKVLDAYPGRDFAGLSFIEVKNATRKSFQDVIALLANVEGVDWTPPASSSRRRRGRPHIGRFDDDRQVVLTEEVRELAQRALLLPWVDSIPGGDMRLLAPGSVPPAQWLRTQLEQPEASRHLEAVAKSILAAEEMSFAEEVCALAGAALQRAEPAPSAENEGRWVAMFKERYAAQDDSRTLQAIGEEFGVSRERVRQICDNLLEAMRTSPACTPALDRVLRMAERLVPCSLEDVNEQLRRQLGEGSGIRAAMELAESLNKPLRLRIGHVKVRVSGRYEDAPLLESAVQVDTWPQTALRYAAAECTTLGCTSILRIAGALALRDGVAPGQEALVSVFRNAYGFRWLDEDNGWFTVGDTNGCGAATRLRKILAVAHLPVTVDEVAEAFAADTRWFRSTDDRALAVPPTHVIQAMVAGWPWVRAIQHTRLAAVQPIPMDGTLTEVEKKLVELIEANDGVAAAWQLYAGVVETVPVTKIAVSIVLATSPPLSRFEHGLYTLRGRRIRAEALARARQTLSLKLAGALPTDEDTFLLRVTAAALRNEQYTVPTRFMDKLAGRVVPIVGTSHQARVTQSGSMKGINQCFEGLREGDSITVRVAGDALEVQRTPEPAEAPDGESDAPDGTAEA